MDIETLTKSMRLAKEQQLIAHALAVFATPVLFGEVVERVAAILKIDRFDQIKLEQLSGERTIKIEACHQWMRRLQFSARGERKLGIIFAADKLTPDAASSLLKTLEEPPAHTYILLLAERDNLLSTIRSRVQAFYLSATEPAMAAADQLTIPQTSSDIIKTAAVWAQQGQVKERLKLLLQRLRPGLRQGEIKAQQLELVHTAYLNDNVGQNSRLLLERVLLQGVKKSSRVSK